MSRSRYRWDRAMQCVVEITAFSNQEPASKSNGIQIIRDIEPYKTVAADIAIGKPTVISGRRQHREFLKRNGYVEVGNESSPPKRAELNREERINDIRRAMNDH